MTLEHIDNSSTELESKGTMLQTNLTDISTQLDDINTTCSGCVPSNNGFDVTDFSAVSIFDRATTGGGGCSNIKANGDVPL